MYVKSLNLRLCFRKRAEYWSWRNKKKKISRVFEGKVKYNKRNGRKQNSCWVSRWEKKISLLRATRFKFFYYFLFITRPGGGGKSIMAKIVSLQKTKTKVNGTARAKPLLHEQPPLYRRRRFSVRITQAQRARSFYA